MSKRIPDVVDTGRFSVLDEDFDHVKTPWKVPRPKTFEPGIGAPFDEALLFGSHRVERADFRVRTAGFDFDEEQQSAVAGDEVHLAAAGAFEVPGEDTTAPGAEKISGDVFPIIAEPLAVAEAAVRAGQTAG